MLTGQNKDFHIGDNARFPGPIQSAPESLNGIEEGKIIGLWSTEDGDTILTIQSKDGRIGHCATKYMEKSDILQPLDISSLPHITTHKEIAEEATFNYGDQVRLNQEGLLSLTDPRDLTGGQYLGIGDDGRAKVRDPRSGAIFRIAHHKLEKGNWQDPTYQANVDNYLIINCPFQPGDPVRLNDYGFEYHITNFLHGTVINPTITNDGYVIDIKDAETGNTTAHYADCLEHGVYDRAYAARVKKQILKTSPIQIGDYVRVTDDFITQSGFDLSNNENITGHVTYLDLIDSHIFATFKTDGGNEYSYDINTLVKTDNIQNNIIKIGDHVRFNDKYIAANSVDISGPIGGTVYDMSFTYGMTTVYFKDENGSTAACPAQNLELGPTDAAYRQKLYDRKTRHPIIDFSLTVGDHVRFTDQYLNTSPTAPLKGFYGGVITEFHVIPTGNDTGECLARVCNENGEIRSFFMDQIEKGPIDAEYLDRVNAAKMQATFKTTPINITLDTSQSESLALVPIGEVTTPNLTVPPNTQKHIDAFGEKYSPRDDARSIQNSILKASYALGHSYQGADIRILCGYVMRAYDYSQNRMASGQPPLTENERVAYALACEYASRKNRGFSASIVNKRYIGYVENLASAPYKSKTSEFKDPAHKAALSRHIEQKTRENLRIFMPAAPFVTDAINSTIQNFRAQTKQAR